MDLFNILSAGCASYLLARRIVEDIASRRKPVFDIKCRVKLPTYATKGSACIDLYAYIDKPITLHAGEQVKIPSGICVHIKDPRYVGIIAPRSGKGCEGLVISNTVGLVDSDYTGEIMLSLWNRNKHASILINPLDKVCQMGFFLIEQAEFRKVKEFEKTDRGDKGFGSTGK